MKMYKASKTGRLLSFILALLVSISAFSIYDIFESGEKAFSWAEASKTGDTYYLDKRNGKAYFTNYVDGYTLEVDKDMEVDMSKSAVCAVLENKNKRIEIYRQYVGNKGSSSYINYSNKFLKNTFDHKLEYRGKQTIGYNTANIVAWNRKKLARVENDKNNYMIIDMEKGQYVYTICIKANAPIADLGGYDYLVKSFYNFTPTRPGVITASNVVKRENWNKETLDAYNSIFYENKNVSWGIFNQYLAHGDYSKVNYYESYFDYNFPLVLHYTDFKQERLGKSIGEYLTYILNNAKDRGKIVELTLQTSWTQGGNMVYEILDGKHDEFLNEYAKAVADFGHPVMFRLGNEMNGDWCPYSSFNTSRDPQIFNEFYKYIYKIFQSHDAKNLMWVWNPNGKSYPNFKWNEDVMYYPGDEYVDIIGLTAYNTGTYYAKHGEKWSSFDEIYSTVYKRYNALFNQPFMITEFSSASHGGDKNAWVENAFSAINNYERIRAAVWWDGADIDPANGQVARSYYIGETRELLDTFRRNMRK